MKFTHLKCKPIDFGRGYIGLMKLRTLHDWALVIGHKPENFDAGVANFHTDGDYWFNEGVKWRWYPMGSCLKVFIDIPWLHKLEAVVGVHALQAIDNNNHLRAYVTTQPQFQMVIPLRQSQHRGFVLGTIPAGYEPLWFGFGDAPPKSAPVTTLAIREAIRLKSLQQPSCEPPAPPPAH